MQMTNYSPASFHQQMNEKLEEAGIDRSKPYKRWEDEEDLSLNYSQADL